MKPSRKPQLSHDVQSADANGTSSTRADSSSRSWWRASTAHHREAAGRRARGAHEARSRERCDEFSTFRARSSCRWRRRSWRRRSGYDAIIALGAVIRGDTPHFDYVAGEAARGLQQVALETGRAGGVRRADHRHLGAGRGARGRRARQQGLRRRHDRDRDGRVSPSCADS